LIDTVIPLCKPINFEKCLRGNNKYHVKLENKLSGEAHIWRSKR
jgi:hypothetical protein